MSDLSDEEIKARLRRHLRSNPGRGLLPVAFPKGHEFRNPDNPGEGYRLVCDTYRTAAVMASQFEPFGGAPKPAPSTAMPDWLPKLLSGHIHNYA